MARTLAEMAEGDQRIITITAAMPSGTGLNHFQDKYPNRMLDVGIAEEHAVTMAAGLAAGGLKPYFAVYASFFQRGFDQLIHDVCMPNLPVTMLIDRAGLVGEDGETHHGVWDLASMLPVPNLTVLAPRDVGELQTMLRWTAAHDAPCAIRYGRTSVDLSARYANAGVFVPGKWEILEEGTDCTLLAAGSMVEIAVTVHDLAQKQGINIRLVNASSVKPMDEALLKACADKPVFTLEEHVRTGGFGTAVCEFAAENSLPAPAKIFALPEAFITHGSRSTLLDVCGLSPEKITSEIVKTLQMK